MYVCVYIYICVCVCVYTCIYEYNIIYVCIHTHTHTHTQTHTHTHTRTHSYLRDAFGNQTRIDYGTGHETCFVVWLFCLSKLELIKQGDMAAVVLRVFTRYLTLMRKLQTVYMLEPAGSHGVWSLDDYQMLPFYWGASQLEMHGLVVRSLSLFLPQCLISFTTEV